MLADVRGDDALPARHVIDLLDDVLRAQFALHVLRIVDRMLFPPLLDLVVPGLGELAVLTGTFRILIDDCEQRLQHPVSYTHLTLPTILRV